MAVLQEGKAGDRIVVDRHRVGWEERSGEILEVLGSADARRYRVRWDDGAEAVYVPGSDAHVEHVPLPAIRAAEEICTQALQEAGIEFEVLPHAPTERAVDEARSLGVKASEVGKTIVLSTGAARARAVIPASERLSLHKVRDLLDVDRQVRLATEAEVAKWYPMFALGAIPPMAGPGGDTVLVDRRIAGLSRVVIEAGEPHISVSLSPADLVELTGAKVGDLCVD